MFRVRIPGRVRRTWRIRLVAYGAALLRQLGRPSCVQIAHPPRRLAAPAWISASGPRPAPGQVLLYLEE